jgi:protein SCO1/2
LNARGVAALALLAPALAAALPIGQALHKPVPVTGEAQLPAALKDVEIEEKLGSKLPLEARFTAQDGRAVRLGDLFGGRRPVVLSLVYFDCPMLCGLILTGAARGMRETGLELGKDFDAVTVSFDPRDSTRVAAERQRGYLQAFGSPEAKQAWTFLTGSEPEIHAVTGAVGFKYAWDEPSKQFAHPAAIFVLTPDGRVSRYLYGIEFPGRDLRLALVEASEGRVGTSFDRLLLTCFRYDPASRKYEPYVMGVVRIVMLGVLAALGLLLAVFWRREIKGKRVSGGPAPARPAGGAPPRREPHHEDANR